MRKGLFKESNGLFRERGAENESIRVIHNRVDPLDDMSKDLLLL
jgi:hypothetical protein